MGISQNSDFVADISKEHRGQPTVVSDALREMLFSDSLELWRLGSRRFIRRSVEILPCKRSERFVLTFFQKPLDNLFGLCYNTSCSVERSTDGNAALAQLDRVPGYEPVGRGFESPMPRQNKNPACVSGRDFCFVLFIFHYSSFIIHSAGFSMNNE